MTFSALKSPSPKSKEDESFTLRQFNAFLEGYQGNFKNIPSNLPTFGPVDDDDEQVSKMSDSQFMRNLEGDDEFSETIYHQNQHKEAKNKNQKRRNRYNHF